MKQYPWELCNYKWNIKMRLDSGKERNVRVRLSSWVNIKGRHEPRVDGFAQVGLTRKRGLFDVFNESLRFTQDSFQDRCFIVAARFVTSLIAHEPCSARSVSRSDSPQLEPRDILT